MNSAADYINIAFLISDADVWEDDYINIAFLISDADVWEDYYINIAFLISDADVWEEQGGEEAGWRAHL